jgi:hypothetical protein
LPWTKITGTPTTLAGYGITDAYTQTQVNTLLNAKQNTLTLTTTGTSGVATLIGATLNIPDYGGALGAYLPLAGGTMTGNINWAQTDRGIVWAFNTDGASIKFYNTGDGDTDSRLEFATLDNNDEYFRWGHIPSGFGFYESMRLVPNSSGNAQLIVSGSIIKSGGTSSQYLMADGSVSTLTNPVTGTGNTNRIAKFTSGSSIGDSQILDNGTSVDIGSPSTISDIKLNVNGAGRFVSNPSSRALYLVQNGVNAGNIIQFQNQSGADIWELVARNNQFYIYNTALGIASLYINPATNNVSINNSFSDAGFKFDVNGTARVTSMFTGGGGIKISGSGGPFIGAYTPDGLFGATANPNFISTTGNGSLLLGYADNEAGLYSTAIGYYVKSTDGNGTPDRVVTAFIIRDIDKGTAPFIIRNNGTIESLGQAFFSSSVTANTFINTSQVAMLLNNSGVNNDFRLGSSTSAFRVVNSTNTIGLFSVQNSGEATFSSSVTAATGIFSISAGNPLQVYQTSATNSTTATIRQTGAGGNGNNDIGLVVDIQGAADNDRIVNFRYFDGTNNNSRFVVQRGGNVGIGTASPSQRLEVAGVIRGEAVNVYGSTNPASTSPYLFSPSLAALGFGGNGSEKMRIFSDGNVLIQSGGTFTNAGFRLEVNGTGRFSGSVDITGTGDVLVLRKSNNVPAVAFIGTSTNKSVIEGGDNLDFYTGNIKRLTIASTGAATFSSSLRVNGGSRLVGSATVGEDTTQWVLAGIANGGAIFQKSHSGAGGPDDRYLRFGNVNNNGIPNYVISIINSNTGFGTTSPNQRVHIDGQNGQPATSGGTQNGLLRIQGGSGVGFGETLDMGFHVGVSGPASYAWLQSTNTGSLGIVYNLCLNPNGGRVGIGTNNPTHLFSVSRPTEAAAYQININSAGGISTGNFTGIRFSQDSNASTELGNIRLNYFTDGSTALSLGTRFSAQAIYINSGGNVTIGSTSDTGDKLFVSAVNGGNGNITASGRISYSVGFSAYTPDGLFSANALPGRIFTPSGSDRIRFGYFDQGGGQYWGRIGFQGNTNWSLGTSQGGHSFSIGTNNGNNEFLINNAGAATFSSSVTASSFFESSDARLKSNITNLDVDVRSILAKHYIKEGVEEIGYLAQDVESILPSAISKRKDGYLDLSYRQVHTAKIAYLEKRITELESQLKNN